MLSQSKSNFHFLGNHFGNFLNRCPNFSILPVLSIHHDYIFDVPKISGLALSFPI